MKRFWCSWYQPTEDERPLTCPPNAGIIGWWRSGYRVVDNGGEELDEQTPILCALVSGKNYEDAAAAVKADWPEATDWRFFREVERDFNPGSRFPLDPWMEERIA